MTVLERKKYRLIRSIMDDTDVKRVAEIERLYSTQEPCMYTIDEIKASLPKRIKDIEDGKGIPHDVVMQEYGL